MATNKCVIVLTPNGRRYNIKVTPDTTILQVLEEACKKQGLKPEEYDIKHHNHILDTNVLIRFSGLPNNAQLEMAAAKKSREESEVTLCIQLESGDRQIGTFHPSDTLWTVISKLLPNEANSQMNPVVIYTRKEVCGKDALEETTLRQLGLTGGRAILRFLHRTAEELHKQANVSAPLPHKPSVEKVTRFPQKQNPPTTTKKEAVQSILPQELSLNTTVTQQEVPKDGTAAQQEVPNNTPAKQQPSKNVPTTPQQFHILSETIQEVSHNVETQFPQEKMQESNLKAASVKTEPMDVDVSSNIENEVSISRTNAGETACIKSEPLNEEIINLGERNALAFSLEMAQAVPSDDLPDDFFELTTDDVRALFRDLKRRREEMEQTPLITSAQRELEESKRVLRQLNQYRRSVIRVQFPDRTVLQGTFSPIETISVVEDFVRGYLENADKGFYLYTTPPKRILLPAETLVDAQCVPNAMVYFGTKEQESPAKKSYLCEDILSKLSTPNAATLAANSVRCMKQTRMSSSSGNLPQPGTKEENINATDNKPSTSSGAKFAKLPKWFKPLK